jgi:UDP-N-acetylmuramoyl-tripeptide--D-alanyl-D-alanine ligase
VARAKGEILGGLHPEGVAVLNGDDPFFPYWREQLGERRLLSFGSSPRAHVRADLERAQTRWTETGFSSAMRVRYREREFEVELALAGRHNLLNALAAIAAALALDCTETQIQRGLAAVEPVQGRLRVRRSSTGLRLIDDSYNANPDSVDAAVAVLQQAPGDRWLVLGDLAELGDQAPALHAEIGRRARAAGVPHLLTLGRLSREAAEAFGDGAEAFEQIPDLVAALERQVSAGDTLLIKGSRSAGMERVVKLLLGEGGV